MILYPETPSSSVTSLRINAVVCALPDVLLDPQMWEMSSSSLADCPLLQHAKVIPHSFATIQYFLNSGALTLISPSPNNPTSSGAIVLNCHDTLVECTSYILQHVSSDYVEVEDSDSLYMAEIAGYVHSSSLCFAKLATQQVKLMNSQFRHKMEQSQVDGIIKSCCDHFWRLIFPGFCNDGRVWEVDYDALQSDFTVWHGRLKFANGDIRACFGPSIMLLRKMITETVGRIRDLHGMLPSHVLLAGTYANSSFLTANIRNALEDCRSANERGVSLLQAPEGENVCALGALYHAKSC
ncbi:hypothetical protein B0T24DRAFT_577253 [Lasiosphaeria ovina]|uniref:Uncharacterized protein n=1 Tax=Lasiosphaeria ovina TaxID=92902 RepID=A0AAE0KDR1_9PEZI|nr:hypothetical protein B0T24DRAFT_577253 [Lasiosphaeria ovina]